MLKFADELKFVMETTWPIVVITLISLISLRITFVVKNKRKFVVYEELLLLIFVVYVLMFFQIVTYQDVINYGNNFIPFKELTRYRFGSKLFYRNIIGNILLFLPYGFFSSYYLRLKKGDIKLATFLIIIVSFSIEIVQLLIGRCFDVDDILLNMIGGICGYYLYLASEKITNNMAKNTISTILIAIIIILTVMLLYMMM